MNKHPLLRAYLAGIAVPTAFLMVVAIVFTYVRYVSDVPLPIERVIVFPMAFVPNLWGLWNVLYVSIFSQRHISLGLLGALLPLLLAPMGVTVAHFLHFPIPQQIPPLAPIGLPIGMVLYYLAWKYLVGFFNTELGIG